MGNWQLLEELCAVYGPSGREREVRNLIERKIAGKVDQIQTDKLGNLIALRKGDGSGRKIVLSAHMDQLGLMVKMIDDQGYLRFSQLGSLKPFNLLDQRVIFPNGIQGVVLTELKDQFDKLDLNQLYIDLGMYNRKAIEKSVSIADVAVVLPNFHLTSDMIISPCLDDRIGCFILLECLLQSEPCAHDVYYVFTTQEEVGCKGAVTASYNLNPDFFVTIDVTGTQDELRKVRTSMTTNAGVGIKVRDPYLVVTECVLETFRKIVAENSIRHQWEVCDVGGTDATSAQLTRSGVHSGAITLATRNIHSANEMIAQRDVLDAISLCRAILKDDLAKLP